MICGRPDIRLVENIWCQVVDFALPSNDHHADLVDDDDHDDDLVDDDDDDDDDHNQ